MVFVESPGNSTLVTLQRKAVDIIDNVYSQARSESAESQKQRII